MTHAITIPEYDQGLALTMSEAELDRNVDELRQVLGYELSYHTHDSRRSAGGFPDRVLLRPGWAPVFIELKSERGQPTFEQWYWLYRLQESGAEAYLFRPSDWLSGEIERCLR